MALMTNLLATACTAFAGNRFFGSGSLIDMALAIKAAGDSDPPILLFDDASGRVIDLDLSGSTVDIVARLTPPPEPARGRGRPSLGVVAREVTLLPRHWDWLADQPGGASQAMRRLVDAARKADAGRTAARQSSERTWRFLNALAGDLPGFEAASRALFAGDRTAFAQCMSGWPAAVRAYALQLAASDPA
jgi:uncharacterized protein